MKVAIISELDRPRGGGAFNGMWALQEVLRRKIRRERLDWLQFSDRPEPGSIPWIWCWEQREVAARLARDWAPFLVGPNVFFSNSRRPRVDGVEAAVLDATTCLAIFCHSRWYRRLILEQKARGNNAPIWCWPYPVRPLPGPPVERVEWDVLVFEKSGPDASSVARDVASQFSRSRIVRYGEFQREDLYEWARRSRSCLYLSDDESGGLVTQEIMLAGCPVVGIERGAPLVEDGVTGIRATRWGKDEFLDGLERCARLERKDVRRAALRAFDEESIGSTVLGHLEKVKRAYESLE